MVQTTDLRDGNDFTLRWRLDAAWCRRVVIQREMKPGIVIVLKVFAQHAMQMGFVEYNHMIQTVSADRTDDTFAVRILPRRTGGDQDFVDSQAFYAIFEIVAVGAVAITNEKTRRFFVREGVDDLLGGPYGVGISGHVEVNDLAPVVTENDEDVQNAKSRGRNGEEITGGNIGNMIGQSHASHT